MLTIDAWHMVSYQQKSGSMYLGDLTEEKKITLSHVIKGRSEGCPPSEDSLGCLKGMKLSLCPLSQFYMAVQAQTWSSLPPEKPESKAADSAHPPACLPACLLV